MPDDNRKPFSLVPRDSKEPSHTQPTSKQLSRRIRSVASAAVKAPDKLARRANEELYKRNAELAVRNKTLALLRKLDEISLVTVKMEDLAGQMTEAIAIELGYDVVSIVIVKEESDSLQWLGLSSSVPWISELIRTFNLERLHVSVSDKLQTVAVLKSDKPLYADNPREVYPAEFVDALTAADQSPDIEEVKHSMLYPLSIGKHMLGLLTLSSSRSLKEFSRYEQESVTGIVGLVSLALYKADIYGDLQDTSAKLAKANEQLKTLDKAKSEFLSVASHQLYTPLTALRGYVSMLQEGDFGLVNKQQLPVLDILLKSAVRLIELIRDLLDISRIESGRLELNLESIDVAQITQELVRDLMPNALNKHLTLSFVDPQKTLSHVVADSQRIRQVMLNLVDNAIKYTASGGIGVQIAQEGDELVCSVKDTGKGMTQDEIDRLFTKFTRVGGSSRFHTEGTGLGLYVAKQIVGEHHGDVSVESSGPNKGSTFIVRLPIEGSLKSLTLPH